MKRIFHYFLTLLIFSLKLDKTSYNVLKRRITNTPLHETQIDGHRKSCLARATYRLVNYLQAENKRAGSITKYCKHWLKYFPGCVFWGNSWIQKRFCFVAKIWSMKHEAKESKIRSRLSLNLLSSLFFGTDVENIHLNCGNPVKIYTCFLFRSFTFTPYLMSP